MTPETFTHEDITLLIERVSDWTVSFVPGEHGNPIVHAPHPFDGCRFADDCRIHPDRRCFYGSTSSFPVDLITWDRAHETDGEAAIRHHMREHLQAFVNRSPAYDPATYATGTVEDKDDVLEAVRRAWDCHPTLTLAELISLGEQEARRLCGARDLWDQGPGALAAALDMVATKQGDPR